MSRLTAATVGTALFGVFRDVQREVYGELMAEQLDIAVAKRGGGDLAALLRAGDTSTIE